MDLELLEKRLSEWRRSNAVRAPLRTNGGSATLALIIGLADNDFMTLTLLAVLRVADCLICFLEIHANMPAVDRSTYRELAENELVCSYGH
jgi:hypothetical protein